MFDFGRFGNRIAIQEDSGSFISYNELQILTDSFSKSVSNRGLVLCFCQNSIASVVGYIACINSGNPVILVNSNIDDGKLSDYIELYNPEYLWVPKANYLCVAEESLFQFEDYFLCSKRYDKDLMPCHPSLALCLSTSGSTGSPKLVRLTKENLLSNARSIIMYLDIKQEDRPILFLPLHYSYGLSILNTHLLVGATILLTDKSVGQPEFWTFVKEQRATSFYGVPYTYEMLVRFRLHKMNLPHLTTFCQAGGKLSADLVRLLSSFMTDNGKRFYVMYGQTEASPRISYLPAEYASDYPSSIGIAIPDGKMCLVDDKGNEIFENNKEGQLVYTGPNVCMGYAVARKDLSVGDINQGTLLTGDLAYRDNEGFYYITGRLKRFVKIWGNRCSLDEIEQMVKEIVPECACTGVDNQVTIFITEIIPVESVLNHLSARTGLNSTAFSIRYISEIPKSSSGKILYSSLL